ncbi:PREDICTED: probable pectate lyase 5 [Ipomoea nil]|uniref:probable pectate lyase 5 n=1 Tax=Ipomoea nil TaxID=35883 RepID=UPI0009019FD8|nr:PREDICTED: probable pectate lyase 5 [Ipomoea nil]
MFPTAIATCILLFCLILTSSSLPSQIENATLTLTSPHPNPEAVIQEVQRKVKESVWRRNLLLLTEKDQCQTGNPIDDCWRCDPNWANNQQLADCAIGFGREATGGKGGKIYVVSDSSDDSAVEPKPGTLRHAVIQTEPLWIVFAADMTIDLRHELVVSSYKTVDGRGSAVRITGVGCIILESVSNVIIHNLQIYNCVPSKREELGLSPTQREKKSKSDGDGITVRMSKDIWIDHCALSKCTDGLIDVTEGSTAVTISNSYFSHHDKVMLLGHTDSDSADDGMQVTVAFNRFGEGLEQRMPRCRRGYFHVVNNDYTSWGLYAIGGSGNPTINCQGNRFTAPADTNLKEVTKRLEAEEKEWQDWNWRSNGDVMENGAFFVPSGDGKDDIYAKASSTEPMSGVLIDQLIQNVGVLCGPGLTGGVKQSGDGSSNWNGYMDGEMNFGGGASSPQSATVAIFLSFFLLVNSLIF